MICIQRIPRPPDMSSAPIIGGEPQVKEIREWVSARLIWHGLESSPDPWSLLDNDEISKSDSLVLYAVLTEIVDRAITLVGSPGYTEWEHIQRIAFNRQAEGIVRALTKHRTPFDGSVFARLYEWPGWIPGGAVAFFFWYAPMKTLRSIEGWFHEVTSSEGVELHERAFLLRPLGRLDPSAAVSVARDLALESPYATSEVLGMFGGPNELPFMRSLLPEVASREEARTRRHFEAGIRKLERRFERGK